jgi:hypothetical protein
MTVPNRGRKLGATTWLAARIPFSPTPRQKILAYRCNGRNPRRFGDGHRSCRRSSRQYYWSQWFLHRHVKDMTGLRPSL